jgi:hypothetical protein
MGDAGSDADEGHEDQFGQAVSVVGDAADHSSVGAVYGFHLWLDVFSANDISDGVGDCVWPECWYWGLELHLVRHRVFRGCSDSGEDQRLPVPEIEGEERWEGTT